MGTSAKQLVYIRYGHVSAPRRVYFICMVDLHANTTRYMSKTEFWVKSHPVSDLNLLLCDSGLFTQEVLDI
eukprot:c14403_g1_i1 orf=2-211(-)